MTTLKDLDNYELKPNEVFIYLLQHNIENCLFQSTKKWLAYIMIRGDPDEIYYYYGWNEEKSNILYLTHKLPLPNIFQGTAFKKHYSMLIYETKQQFINFSKLFFIFPTTTDRKEKINQFISNIQLHPIDIDPNDFAMKYSQTKKVFNPSDLDSKNVETRLEAREVLESFFKEVVEISNTNLVRNSRALIATTKFDTENFVSITETEPQNNNSRFKLDSY